MTIYSTQHARRHPYASILLFAAACCAILLWLAGYPAALAEEAVKLPDGVVTLCQQAYPDHQISTYHGWGTEDKGQFAMVLSKDEQHVLCIAEKTTADTAYQFSVANAKALHRSTELPRLLMDTGGDSLFFTYTEGPNTYSYHSVKEEDGQWSPVDVINYDTVNFEEQTVYFDGTLLHINFISTDAEGNVWRNVTMPPIPAVWLTNQIRLNEFDIEALPTSYWSETISSRLQLIGDVLLPQGCIVLGGCVRKIDITFLADKPDGTRRVFIYQWDQATANWIHVESSPLPSNASIDSFHSWEDVYVYYTLPDASRVGYIFTPNIHNQWGLSYVMGEDWFALTPNAIGSRNDDEQPRHYGSHPWSDIREIDWNTMPTTYQAALTQLDNNGWAMVTSTSPANRLNLRTSPQKDAPSVGKYYSGTIVKVLKEQGNWINVDIYGVHGWVMKEYLAFGDDMRNVNIAIPQLQLKLEDATTGVNVYASPKETAPVLDICYDKGWPAMMILGVSGDNWYHVVFENTGLSGYIRQDSCWPGNG